MNVVVADRDRLDADQVAEPAGEEHAGQRGDERLDVEVVDDQPHQQAEQRCRRAALLPSPGPGDQPASQGAGGDHGGQRDHRADAQVDAAGEDHEGHPHGEHDQEGVVHEQVQEDLRGGEALVAHAAGAEHARRTARGWRAPAGTATAASSARTRSQVLGRRWTVAVLMPGLPSSMKTRAGRCRRSTQRCARLGRLEQADAR